MAPQSTTKAPIPLSVSLHTYNSYPVPPAPPAFLAFLNPIMAIVLNKNSPLTLISTIPIHGAKISTSHIFTDTTNIARWRPFMIRTLEPVSQECCHFPQVSLNTLPWRYQQVLISAVLEIRLEIYKYIGLVSLTSSAFRPRWTEDRSVAIRNPSSTESNGQGIAVGQIKRNIWLHALLRQTRPCPKNPAKHAE